MSSRALNNIINDLTCPITLNLFIDPISLPCCGKAIERNALIEHNSRYNTCPLCRGSLENLDIISMPKNVTLFSLVEEFKNNKFEVKDNNRLQIADNRIHKWSGRLYKLKNTNVKKLVLHLDNAKFESHKSLFIPVVDRSGSMAGNPWKQVEMALLHILAITENTNNVKIMVVAYDSSAVIADFNEQIIKTLFTGGGTSFISAFNKIYELLGRIREEFSSIHIAFMTDGQDNTPDLARSFRIGLRDHWMDRNKIPIIVHSIGFGAGCDKQLLEDIRKCGSEEGVFRYAEPEENNDALCQKITGVFDFSSKCMKTYIDLIWNDRKEEKNPICIDVTKHGKLEKWYINGEKVHDIVSINSEYDVNTEVKLEIIEDQDKQETKNITDEYFKKIIEKISHELILISKSQEYTSNLKDLHLCLIIQRLKAINTSDLEISQQIDILKNQANILKNGGEINLGKLYDLRYASLFSNKISEKKQLIKQIENKEELKAIQDAPYFERYVKYTRNNTGKNRNILQEFIVNTKHNILPDKLRDMLSIENIIYTDSEKNTALHLAAYCGHSLIVELLLSFIKDYKDLINQENSDGETPVTLAIKKQGYNKTLLILLNNGGIIPEKRSKALMRYAIDNGYKITAEIIENASKSIVDVDETMSQEYISYLYEKVQNKDLCKWLYICMRKKLIGLCQDLCEEARKQNIKLDSKLLFDTCIPIKPDDPEVNIYLQMSEMILQYDKDLLFAINENKETLLFKAAESGNLPLVKYYYEKGCPIDRVNNLGNSPLWISCAKRWPCIVEYLVLNGANPNLKNYKGNVPLYSICQRGPVKLAEFLLEHNAAVDIINDNGDTLILIACRNGQEDILRLLLNYVNEEFINRKAHIDGFNAIFASVEANRPGCINALYEYGVTLEQKTDNDNKILPGATLLHLAAYYGRYEACKILLELGINANAKDINGYTALHTAVIQGHNNIIDILLRFGTDIYSTDNNGNIPLDYAQDVSIIELLKNPCLDILNKLAMGEFDKKEEKLGLEILQKYASDDGIISQASAINIRGQLNPLMSAVIYKNYNVAKVLNDMGADWFLEGINKTNAYIWAYIAYNDRIVKLFENEAKEKNKINEYACIKENISRNRYVNGNALHLLNRPKTLLNKISTFTLRSEPHFDTNIETKDISTNNIINLFKPIDITENQYASLLWNAKILALSCLGYIESSTTKIGSNILNCEQILILCLYTSSPLLQQTFGVVRNSIKNLPNYIGEVYMASDVIDRNKLIPNSIVSINGILSATTLWRVATKKLIDFKKNGTTFIIKTKTAKFIGNYSWFAEGEVIISGKYKVNAWYRTDPICLGQENIREHTFGIKNNEYSQFIKKSAVIIELEEL